MAALSPLPLARVMVRTLDWVSTTEVGLNALATVTGVPRTVSATLPVPL